MRAYTAKHLTYSALPGAGQARVHDGFEIFVFFPSGIVVENEQYYLYDLASVVSAVGGGLGLFLGFSCLALASKAITWTLGKACSDSNHGKEIGPAIIQA